ncbi:MAG: hypothetical protein A3H95_05810 [Acidobacteria bacterium RIFCSPLOWO2_02_FULL_64_15]|nr:MAG: hypothetical protein A3H95_05810 [Acidobacteria bacterium RIFCSPLOWO2_02_FULL_64_15]
MPLATTAKIPFAPTVTVWFAGCVVIATAPASMVICTSVEYGLVPPTLYACTAKKYVPGPRLTA